MQRPTNHGFFDPYVHVCVLSTEKRIHYQLGCRYSLAHPLAKIGSEEDIQISKSQSGFLKQKTSTWKSDPLIKVLGMGITLGLVPPGLPVSKCPVLSEASDIVQWNDGDKEQITPAILGVRHTDSARPPRCGCARE